MLKVILVTGANSGIGFELVRLLAEKGHTVYLGARNERAGKEAVGQLHADGLTSVKFVCLDVTDAASIQAAKETIEKAEEKLDVLVNNAGISVRADQNPASISLSTVRDTMEVNFFGVIQTTTTLLPLIRKSTNGGVIVNVSSELGSNTFQSNRKSRAGAPLLAAYSSSKAALNSYTIALAHELKGEGIKVNAVTPGLTSTNLTDHIGKTTKAGAEVLLPWALLEKDGPTGRFIGDDDNIEFPW